MAVEIYYRYNSLDKKHEYGIVTLFGKQEYENYWTYWLWYYLGAETKGKHRNPSIIVYANTWDEKCKLIKTYKDTRDAQKCAIRINNFIQKHYSKQIRKQIK